MARRRVWRPPDFNRDAVTGRMTVPSWLLSIAVHAALIGIFLLSLQSWDRGASGASDEDSREVGIYIKDAADQTETMDAEQQSDDPAPEDAAVSQDVPPSEAELAEATADSLSDIASDKLDLPDLTLPNTIGSGTPLSLPSTAASADLIEGLKGAPSRSVLRTAGHGETSFFDIKAEGTRFAYVVDHSGSMSEYGALLIAKSELLASLQSLDATQQFHIVFYNGDFRELTLKGRKPALQWGTDINRTLTRHFVAAITPSGGTQHMPALMKALSYRPEHMFFLTDAKEPELSPRDLQDIKRYNRGRTQIHCVEFGKTGDLGIDNFLKRLARQNGGTYRYRDVRNFGKD